MDWIGAKVDWINRIRFFAHPYLPPNHDQLVFPYLFTPIIVIIAKKKVKQSQNTNRTVS